MEKVVFYHLHTRMLGNHYVEGEGRVLGRVMNLGRACQESLLMEGRIAVVAARRAEVASVLNGVRSSLTEEAIAEAAAGEEEATVDMV